MVAGAGAGLTVGFAGATTCNGAFVLTLPALGGAVAFAELFLDAEGFAAFDFVGAATIVLAALTTLARAENLEDFDDFSGSFLAALAALGAPDFFTDLEGAGLAFFAAGVDFEAFLDAMCLSVD